MYHLLPTYHVPCTMYTIKKDKAIDRRLHVTLSYFILLFISFLKAFYKDRGRNNSVGIATRYGLDRQGIETRWGASLSLPIQTGPRSHSASRKMGTGFLFRGQSGRGVTLTCVHSVSACHVTGQPSYEDSQTAHALSFSGPDF